MITSLCFNDFTFSPVTRDNQPWFRSPEIARALGYKREDILGKLYRKNADEFTSEMTQVVEIVDNADSVFPVKVRIFSLRGCHLLAMFARTPVAKAFRKWVLDVLDKLAEEERARRVGDVKELPVTHQAHLKAIVDAVGMLPAAIQRKAFAEIWSRFARHFRNRKNSLTSLRKYAVVILLYLRW